MAAAGEEAVWRGALQWTIAAPLARVWALTHDFNAVDKWGASVLARCSIAEGIPQQPGCVRRVEGRLPNPALVGGEAPYALEKLLELDAAHHMMTYVVVQASFPPFVGLHSTLQFVEAAADGLSTRVLWSYERSPMEGLDEQGFKHIMETLYNTVVGDLQKAMAASNAQESSAS